MSNVAVTSLSIFDLTFIPTLEVRTIDSNTDVEHIRLKNLDGGYNDETFIPDPEKLSKYIQI